MMSWAALARRLIVSTSCPTGSGSAAVEEVELAAVEGSTLVPRPTVVDEATEVGVGADTAVVVVEDCPAGPQAAARARMVTANRPPGRMRSTREPKKRWRSI
jgi:hypothetical protein